MSYDLTLGDLEFNYTYNVSRMFYDYYVMDGIRTIRGKTGEEAHPLLTGLLKHMQAHPERMRGMEPSNGWGSYEGAMNWVSSMIDACLQYPTERWEGW
jgi:hypothetical protein